jgi:hypothetical protein
MQPNENYSLGGISITDWIQTFGALVAIIASIFAFVKLFIRDKEKAQQIESLSELARQSQLQTQQLFSHSIHMNEANILLREQIEIFKERLSIEKINQGQREKEKEIEKRIRKNDIQPTIYQTNGHGTNELLKIELTNKGGQAKIIRVDIIEGSTKVRADERLYDKVVGKSEEFTIIIKSLNQNINANNVDYSFDLIFENADNELYSQRFNCHGISCKIEQPKELR